MGNKSVAEREEDDRDIERWSRIEKNRRYCHCAGCNGQLQETLLRIGCTVSRKAHWYHPKCYEWSEIKPTPQSLPGFHGLDEEDQEIIKKCHRKYYRKLIKKYMKLPKKIEKMTVKELESELKKRRIRYKSSSKKQEKRTKLQAYLDRSDVKDFQKTEYEIICHGFVRRIEKKYKDINIPVYLTNIAIKYCA